MSIKISVSLEQESYDFLEKRAKNRSAYINELLLREARVEEKKLWAQAYIDQENDPEFHQEKQLWEITVGDGIGNSEEDYQE